MSGPAGRATNEPSNYFAFGVQGAKDQDAGTFYFFKHLDGTGFDVAADVSSEREGGAGREISLRYKTLIKADGQCVAYARPDGAARLLTYALGSDTVKLVATEPAILVEHLIQSGINASLPYLTADQTWADISERTGNCVVTELKIDGEAGHPAKLTTMFISGGSPHMATEALTPSREGGEPIGLPGASAYLELSGGSGVTATSIELTKFSAAIKNQLDESIQTTGLNREDVIWLNAEYTVDGTLKYVDGNLWKQQQYKGGSQVAITLATGAFKFFSPQFSSGGSQSLAIGLPLVQLSAIKVNRLDPDGKTMYYDFTAATIKGATSSFYAKVFTGATTAYTATAT